MNNLTEVTKYRESQNQQHRKEKKTENKRIIGRQIQNGTQTHTHTHTHKETP
jgi:hypothetical protein